MRIAPVRSNVFTFASLKNNAKNNIVEKNQSGGEFSNKLPLYPANKTEFGGGMLFSANRLLFQKTGSLSFGKQANVSNSFRQFEVTGDKIKEELELSFEARKLGVNTPKISEDLRYKIFGQEADPKTNPLDERHFKSILDEIFKMDSGELYHGDIERAHVFYFKEGGVELDCFRFGCLFEDDPGRLEWDFPQAMYPSNATQYENLSLGYYLSKIPDDTLKTEVLDKYLKEAGAFHKKRAEFLTQSKKGTDEQIKYEKLCAELFKNPNSKLMDLFKKRIEFQYGHRKMFTDWDEGFGACGHKPDEKRTTDAVTAYFDVIKANMRYLEDLKAAKEALPEGNMKDYFGYEEKYASHWLQNHSASIKGMSNWTLDPDNKVNKTHRNVSEEQRSELEDLFNEFAELKDFDEKTAALQAAKEKYLELLQI